MNQIVNEQTQLFFVAIQIGIVFGMFYDVLRVIRKILPHMNWMVQIEDLIYWVGASFIGFIILYVHNYSALRFFVFIGILLGAILYFSTASILFMKIATWIIFFTKKLLCTCMRILKIPLKWVFNLSMLPFKLLRKILQRGYEAVEKRKRKWKRKAYYHKADLYTAWQLKIKK